MIKRFSFLIFLTLIHISGLAIDLRQASLLSVPQKLQSDVSITPPPYQHFGDYNSIDNKLDKRWVEGFKKDLVLNFDSALLLDTGSLARPFHSLHGPHDSPDADTLPGGRNGLGKGLVAIGIKNSRVFVYDKHLKLIRQVSGYTQEEFLDALESEIELTKSSKDIKSERMVIAGAIGSTIGVFSFLIFNEFGVNLWSSLSVGAYSVATAATFGAVYKFILYPLTNNAVFNSLRRIINLNKSEYVHTKNIQAMNAIELTIVNDLYKHLSCKVSTM